MGLLGLLARMVLSVGCHGRQPWSLKTMVTGGGLAGERLGWMVSNGVVLPGWSARGWSRWMVVGGGWCGRCNRDATCMLRTGTTLYLEWRQHSGH
jgi:hypothetical protein